MEKRRSPDSFGLEAAAFPLFVILVIIAGLVFRENIAAIYRNREAARAWIEGLGFWGPLVFIGLQALQVVVFVIPGELTQAMGGFIFGFWGGTILSLAGIAIGSLINYGIGRLSGRPFLHGIMGEERLMRSEKALGNRKAEAGLFLLFLVPGIPKDILCYAAGMARSPLTLFMAASMTARLPGIAGSSLIGMTAYAGRIGLSIWLLSGAALLLVSGIVWRKPLETWFARQFDRKGNR
ncbi:MAG: TVP38/TMEM64 family protein [Spirochaetae bacterium HGW-Spirochaetae-9]|nr:MAG: TVP38/TMEM64 family protein [Spirochaetae bacterium HGW-Spirochaetae-9]